MPKPLRIPHSRVATLVGRATLAVALAIAGGAFAAAGTDESFSFVAIGDMPYHVPRDYARFARLIDAINAAKPAFTVHVGDIKSGGTPCTDEAFQAVLALFNRFDNPWVYTPGDNDWTDCHRKSAGQYDPLERLAKVRALFFPGGRSPARSRLGIVQQSDGTEFAEFVENARWERNSVLFVTLHVVGDNNNWGCDPDPSREFRRRNDANRAWLRQAFARARQQTRRGVVVIIHANPFVGPRPCHSFGSPDGNPFGDFLADLDAEVARFGAPVLLVHGDSHVCRVDSGMRGFENLTRAEVFGDTNIHGLRITVDTEALKPFGIEPLIVEDNLPRRPRCFGEIAPFVPAQTGR